MFRPENLMFDFTAEEEEQEKLFEAEAKALKKRFVYLPGGQRAGACCGFEEK